MYVTIGVAYTDILEFGRLYRLYHTLRQTGETRKVSLVFIGRYPIVHMFRNISGMTTKIELQQNSFIIAKSRIAHHLLQ